jgi:hypothetical protein
MAMIALVLLKDANMAAAISYTHTIIFSSKIMKSWKDFVVALEEKR